MCDTKSIEQKTKTKNRMETSATVNASIDDELQIKSAHECSYNTLSWYVSLIKHISSEKNKNKTSIEYWKIKNIYCYFTEEKKPERKIFAYVFLFLLRIEKSFSRFPTHQPCSHWTEWSTIMKYNRESKYVWEIFKWHLFVNDSCMLSGQVNERLSVNSFWSMNVDLGRFFEFYQFFELNQFVIRSQDLKKNLAFINVQRFILAVIRTCQLAYVPILRLFFLLRVCFFFYFFFLQKKIAKSSWLALIPFIDHLQMLIHLIKTIG